MTTLETQNGDALEAWLKQAVCGLSAAAAASVRTEIQAHYESAREAAMSSGATPEEADRAAVEALGSAEISNRLYRKVMLTKSEARLLCEMNWEARMVCSRLRWLAPIPAAGLLASVWFFIVGRFYDASMLLLGMAGIGMLFAAARLPIYTPARSRVFRWVRWAWLAAILVLAALPDIRAWSWLLPACAWPLIWVEWTRFSLRRKLPVTEWPKQLYL